MKPPKVIFDVITNVNKQIHLLQIRRLSTRPIPRTRRYQIPTSETIFANFQASRQLTEGILSTLCPLVQTSKMNVTDGTASQGWTFYSITTPVLWVTDDDKFVVCTDDRFHYVSVRELNIHLNHYEVLRLLYVLQGKEDVKLLRSYTEEQVEFLASYHPSV